MIFRCKSSPKVIRCALTRSARRPLKRWTRQLFLSMRACSAGVQCSMPETVGKTQAARGLELTAGKQPIGELFTFVGYNFLYHHRASLVQGVLERANGHDRGSIVTLDLNGNPSRGVIKDQKQIMPAGLVGHLGRLLTTMRRTSVRSFFKALRDWVGSLSFRPLRLPAL